MFNNLVSKEFKDKAGDTVTLKLQLVPGKKGVALASKLLAVAGGLFASDKQFSLASALMSVADKIDFYDVAAVVFEGAVVSSSQTNYEDFPLNADKFFSGNYGLFVDMLAFALEANFGSFFESQMLGMKTPA